METINRPTAELIPYEKNQKKHPKSQVAQIAESIKQYGFIQPIVIDSENVIIIGHGRLLAAIELGLEEVPVLVANDLTEVQVKALRIADNKLNESPWDKDLLKAELAELYEEGYDTDIITGFDISELHGMGVGIDPSELANNGGSQSKDKDPLQKIGFSVADEQLEVIQKALNSIKRTKLFKEAETFGNVNRSGNAVYQLAKLYLDAKAGGK